MDHVIIDPKLMGLLKKEVSGEDLIGLAPTFYGDEYTDTTAYLKFNNAIRRMAKPRDVEQNETDVEFVIRNEEGSIYAVAYHYLDGHTQTDMLTKMKSGCWMFYNYNTRFHPNFVSTYAASIWGYKKPSELEIAKILASVPAFVSKMVFAGNFVLTIFPGGFLISRYKVDDDGVISSVESIDFVPYENLDRDLIKDYYHNDVLPFCVYGEELDAEHLSEDLVLHILESSLERLRKKYGDKGKFAFDKDARVKIAQKA